MGRQITHTPAGFAALAFLMLASCDQPAPEPAAELPKTPLPAKLCAQVAESLDQFAKSGSFENDRKGGVTIAHDVWLALGQVGQGELTQSVAVDAACAAGAMPKETQVQIRSETGQTLMSRVVELAPETIVLDDAEQ